LTATATPQVADDIVASFRLRDPWILRAGIERENLFLGCQRVFTQEEKLEHLVARLEQLSGAGIVYSSLIRDLEWLHGELARRGIASFVYHGKLSSDERRSMQRRFTESSDGVVLATNAFGMGIDKPDIRFVLHAQIPRTLEAWTQEVGRAGRDGLPSFCELTYFEEDLAIQQNFLQWANPSLEYLVGVYEALVAWGERLQAKDLDDLRAELLVKERRDGRVLIVLGWLDVLGVTQGSFEERNLRVVKPLDLTELPSFLGTGEKLQADLTSLLSMVRFAGDETTCRRVLLQRHFGLPEPQAPCGSCDGCTEAGRWLAERPVGQGRKSPQAGPPSAGQPEAGGYQRGDWVQVGKYLGQVVQVEGQGRKQILVVEGATDLVRRRVDPRRDRVRRLPPS
ncbi:MAG: ATP-dependent DNA helicase RecQ, partial [Planctomycetes bacterium]|nr:ATP-dependent DNA helicase RecQ [Planctomycetota bacterium]